MYYNNFDVLEHLSNGILIRDNEKLYLNSTAEKITGISGNNNNRLFDKFLGKNRLIKNVLDDSKNAGRVHILKQYKLIGVTNSEITVDIRIVLNDPNNFIIEFREEERDKDSQEYWEKKIRELNTLAGGLAHEIKNPLGGIKMAAQMITKIEKDKKVNEYTDIIMEESEKINKVVETLMNISKPIKLNIEKINPHIFLDEFILSVKLQTESKSLKIIKDYDPSIETIIVDKELLAKILFNLLKNSVESSIENDKIIIRTRVNYGFYKEVKGKRYKMVTIEVEDFGKKVTEKEIEKFFTPFYSTKSSGTGLGLVISKHFANLMNCELTVKRKGKGLIFKLTIPAG